MNVKKWNSFGLIFIIILTSFLLGVIFCFKIVITPETWVLKNSDFLAQDEKIWDLNLTKYRYVYEKISENYFDTETIDKNELVEESIRWLVKWLWDKHSEYYDIEEYKQFNESLSGDFEWIWAVVAVHPLWVEVDRLIKGSPAIKYDIRVWDIIISANEQNLEWFTVTQAVSHIKWPAGSKVVLEILRIWESEILTKEVFREKIKIPSVDFELFEENIWYIALNQFGDDTSKEFKNALTELSSTDWIIIDLRDNWGWYLLSAVEILSNLIKRWEILVITKYKEENLNELYRSINNWNIYEWKIVILVNENTASASEIVAGTLREYNKAILVWKKSYWKWSVQQPFELSDWSMVKLTIAKWFTPGWINIDEDWITPDIEVDFIEEDYINLYDRQKEEAKKVLKNFIEIDALNLATEKYLNEKEE